VLVPREETELLVELACATLPRLALDVGTGSGCIAVALAVRLASHGTHVVAVDVSPAALAIARRNIARHGLAEQITVLESDLLAALLPARLAEPGAAADPAAVGALGPAPATFDVICANLPYIDSEELLSLPVSRHEPRLALDGGAGGVVVIARLLDQAPRLLAPGGWVLLEISAAQGDAVAVLARDAFPGADIAVHRDLAGLERVVAIRSAVRAPR
jgi:release factor glutamine methyltransferase